MARQSISRIITALAEADPERVVAEDDDESLTAAELDRRSNRLAREYLALGVRRDSLVSLSLPTGIEAVVVACAIWKCGATPQPVAVGLDASERKRIVQLVDPALVVGFEAEGVPWVPAGFSPRQTEPPGPGDEGALPDVAASSWKAPTSSGSVGDPKVVLAAAPALLDPELPVAPFLPLDGVQLVAGPLMHSATFTYAFRGLMTGQRLVLLPRFDERRVLDALSTRGVTWALLVPTMMHRLLRLPAAEREAVSLDSLATVLHLGAPCAPELKRRFLDWIGPERLVEVYVGSESNGLVMIRGDEWLAHPGSVGRPLPGTEVSVRAVGSSEVLRPGETGQVWLRRAGGPTYRYLGGESSRTEDGWDTLGDLGRLEADGYLYLDDRADDVIVRGGVNVHPTEVERVVEQHPAVRSAVAFGVPDDDLGRRIEVVADVGDANSVSAAQLLEFVRGRIDASRRPSRVHLTTSPVRSDAGKTSRRAYAERFGERESAARPARHAD